MTDERKNAPVVKDEAGAEATGAGEEPSKRKAEESPEGDGMSKKAKKASDRGAEQR